MNKLALFLLAIWWVFFIAWHPGFVHFIQKISAADSNVVATQRALEYATKGVLDTHGDLFFSAAEISHLNDVSKLYQRIKLVSGLFAAFAAGILIYSLHKNQLTIEDFRSTRNILGLTAAVLFLFLVIFPLFFKSFHLVFFPQGNWEFAPDSLLIRLFPEIFWRLILGWAMLGMTIFAAFYHYLGRKSHTHARS